MGQTPPSSSDFIYSLRIILVYGFSFVHCSELHIYLNILHSVQDLLLNSLCGIALNNLCPLFSLV